MTKNPPSRPSSSAPSWLGLPAISDLLPKVDAQMRLSVAARASATSVRLVTSHGERLAQAGEPIRCAMCGGKMHERVEELSSTTHQVETCGHGVYTLQVPVIVESSRAASAVFGPFFAAQHGTLEHSTLERVAAVAELLAQVLAADFASAMRETAPQPGTSRDEERLRLALEATSDAIWDWNLETNQMYYSPRWFAMLGYAPGAFEPTFETFQRMTLAGDAEQAKVLIQRAIDEGTGYETELCMHHADGGVRWILSRGRVSGRDETGRPVRMSGTNTDITERKRVQAEQDALEARLQQAEKLAAMGQLAGGIAHDFNNQLTVVLGNATVLKNHLREPHEICLIDNLVSAASRTAELTRKLLSFARLSHEGKSEVDVHTLIADIIPILGTEASLSIKSQLKAQPSLVRGDATSLSSALLNLALNARDAMPNGGNLTFETRSVWMDADKAGELSPNLQPGPYVAISVSDTGPGITQDVLTHLFEPFFTTKPVGQGTGMSLAAAYGIVRSHGGAIQVQSRIGQGSTFHVYLPYAGDNSQAPVMTQSRNDLVREKRGKRVLVVDDEPLVRQALLALIQAFGYEAECCADGPSAIACLKTRDDIGLVILDLVLPGMGGAAIFRAMRELRPDLQLLVSSGYADSDECRALVAEGAAGTLAKPFRAEELARTLERFLGSPEA